MNILNRIFGTKKEEALVTTKKQELMNALYNSWNEKFPEQKVFFEFSYHPQYPKGYKGRRNVFTVDVKSKVEDKESLKKFCWEFNRNNTIYTVKF